jgi:diguanylate cyclase (GGDEF)-like protein
MIALHFAASIFTDAPGNWGILANLFALGALTWAGVIFMWSSIPYRNQNSSRWFLVGLMFTNSLYVSILIASPDANWPLNLAAVLFGVVPFGLTLCSLRQFNHPLRWTSVAYYALLAVFLLRFQHRPGNGADLAVYAVLFTVYLGCCIHFLYMYRRATAGAFITIGGFLAWASVFVVAPAMAALFPHLQIESGVWNLPKYLVAVGMILLLLENQIEDNKYLALHDPLTGLPNRRLFEDRMASALSRSRRSEKQMALLVIDLDYFKQVNDTLGHHVGDLVLQQVASIFTERVRRSDTVSRTGGDEFSVILEEFANREEAENVGASLRQLLEAPLDLGDHKVQIGASVGIAIFPEDAFDAESLCIAADRRMYEAKQYSRKLNQVAPSANLSPISDRDPEIQEDSQTAQ